MTSTRSMRSYGVRVALSGNYVLPADPATFEVLGGRYARDAERAFYRKYGLRDCDVARLRWLGDVWACDGTNVYADGLVHAADGATFELLGTVAHRLVARDAEAVWIDRSKCTNVDVGSFRWLGAYLGVDRAGGWYFDSDADARGNVLHACRYWNRDFHRESLRVLDDDFAADRERAFYRGIPIKDASGASFTVLGGGYAIDGTRAFWRDEMLGDVAHTIRVLDAYHAVVEDRVYVEGAKFGGDPRAIPYHGCEDEEAIDGDPRTLRVLGFRFSCDDQRVYYRGRVLDGADPATFELVHCGPSSGWARDGARCWWYESAPIHTELHELPCEVAPLDGLTARNDTHIYRGHRILEFADPETFRVRGNGWYSDRTSVWHGWDRVAGARPDTLHVRGTEHAVVEIDDDRELRAVGDGVIAGSIGVVVRGFRVDGPSPASVRSLGGGYLVDADAAYFFERVFQPDDSRHLIRGGRIADADPARVRRDRAFLFDDGRVYRGTACVSDRPSEFRVLDSHHGTDGMHAYHEGRRIECNAARLRALGGSFVVHAHNTFGREIIDDAWATDDTALFLRGLLASEHERDVPFGDDDAALFAQLDLPRLRLLDRWFASDGERVVDLRDGVVLTYCDAATFTPLGGGYARDRGTIFTPTGRWEFRDFVHVGDGYAVEGSEGFYHGERIEDFRAPLVVLGGTWARDGSGILCAGRRMPADPDTFVVLGSIDAPETELDPAARIEDGREAVARDKDFLWFGPYGQSYVPASGVLLGHGFVMTPECVYWQTTPLDVDPATFVVVGEGYGADDRTVYYHWEQIS